MIHSVSASTSDVAAYYDVWTDMYVEAFGDCIQACRPSRDLEFLDYLMNRAGLRDGKCVLDAGCGICGPARHFARRVDITIEALTISPIQAGMAHRKNEEAGLSHRIHVSLGDFHHLTEIYGREAFDVVYFLESLSHSSAPEVVLRSAFEVLKPGGFVYIKDFFVRPCDSAEEQNRVLDVIARVDRIFAVKTAWAHDILRHLNAAGFLRIMVETPRFEVDNTRWQWFESRHQFDLFTGGDSFDWSQWLEMKFQKP